MAKKTSTKEMPPTGPGPGMIFLIVVLTIIILACIFAMIKLYLFPNGIAP